MAKELALPSLEIHNFRGLRELKIKRLGRANLIVGKNSVGKTSLLEALRLYAALGDDSALLEILESRDEIETNRSRRDTRDKSLYKFESIFSGREISIDESKQIRIGPVEDDEKVFRIRLEPMDDDPDGPILLNFHVGDLRKPFDIDSTARSVLGRLARASEVAEWTSRKIRAEFVSPSGIQTDAVLRLWDEISLTSLEQDVLRGVKIVSPLIEKLTFKFIGKSSDRVPFVKMIGPDPPTPLKTLGDGVNRAFGIALAMVNCEDGILLIDEFENGIHYSVQPELWKAVFQMATRLNVQVFATTHSSDCIKAFEEAARENAEEEGVLIRLARKGDRLLVAEFDENEMEIALEGNMELR